MQYAICLSSQVTGTDFCLQVLKVKSYLDCICSNSAQDLSITAHCLILQNLALSGTSLCFYQKSRFCKTCFSFGAEMILLTYTMKKTVSLLSTAFSTIYRLIYVLTYLCFVRQDFTLQLSLASNLLQSSCFSLSSIRSTIMKHYTQLSL